MDAKAIFAMAVAGAAALLGTSPAAAQGASDWKTQLLIIGSVEELHAWIDKPPAERFLTTWCQHAQASGIRVLQQFAKTIAGHRSGLLNWYDHPISTEPLEAANNKLKLLQRRAFGYRDLDFFKLKILSMHNCRFALVG